MTQKMPNDSFILKLEALVGGVAYKKKNTSVSYKIGFDILNAALNLKNPVAEKILKEELFGVFKALLWETNLLKR